MIRPLSLTVILVVGVNCHTARPDEEKFATNSIDDVEQVAAPTTRAPANQSDTTTRYKGLEAYAEKDLSALDGKDYKKLDKDKLAEFDRQRDALTGDEPEERTWHTPKPWWVKQIAANHDVWVCLEVYPGYDVPDVSFVRIHVFDQDWNRQIKETFPTGYRMFLNEVTTNRENPLNQELIVARLTSAGPFIVDGNKQRPLLEQGDFQRQYYAILADRIALVRLEDNHGRIARNGYYWSMPFKGPRVPTRTVEEWINSLRSPNPSEQLATLVWLSGGHLSSTEPRQANVNQESVEDSKLYEAVRASEETKAALRQLAASDNAWVKEYALLAQNEPGQRGAFP